MLNIWNDAITINCINVFKAVVLVRINNRLIIINVSSTPEVFPNGSKMIKMKENQRKRTGE